MKRRILVLLLLFCCLCAGSAAQQFPSQQRGLSADTSFQIGSVDHVNLFNGGLTLTIPVGTSYLVGPNLAFELALTYSSNGWDYEDTSCFDVPQDMTVRYGVPFESPHTNAGFGWRLNPGKLLAQPAGVGGQYVTPDGSERGFYEELHPGFPATPQANTWFSNDGTYQRLRYYTAASGVCTAAPGGSADCFQVEFPDGTVHEFHDFGTAGPEDPPEWLVTRMMDRFDFDQFIAFDYSTAGEWNISDSHGRSHKVVFADGRVSSLELAAFNGMTATWTLTHSSTAIDRQGFKPPSCDTNTPTLTVPLLTRITRPDGAYYEMGYQTSDVTLSGAVESLRFPTGGEFRWEYTGIDFVSQDPELNGLEFARIAWGVSRKEMFRAAGEDTSKIGEWTYGYTTVGNPSMPGDTSDIVPCFHTVEVTDPLGNATVHYFDSATISRWQYGLPFRRCDGAGALEGPPYLSQEIFEGSAATGTKLRRIFLEYDSDGRDSGQNQEKNHRLRLQRVEYEDDPGRFRQTVLSDFDGLGQYRESITTGNFTAAGDSRTVVTRYNPGSGTLLLDPEDSSPLPGNDFVMPAASAPWVLGTFDRREISEAGTDTSITEFCFDTSTGFLERQRVLAGANQLAFDQVMAFVEEEVSGLGTGRVFREHFYGGNPGDLPPGDLCTLSLPDPQRRLEHAYAFGSLAMSRWMDPCDGSEVLQVADFTIDASTGLPRTSRDSAGVATALFYDTLGRQTGHRPPASAWTLWDYDMPTVSSPGQAPRVTIRQCPAGQVSCTPRAWQRASFDGLGRKTIEEREYPIASGVRRAERRLTYNAMGWMTGQSVWDEIGEVTGFDHDRFGRVTKATPPDPGLEPTLVGYVGEHTIERTSNVATGSDGSESWVCQREEYDAFNRLVAVTEDLTSTSGGACSTTGGHRTTYTYDEGGRLNRVCAGASGETCTQERIFTYDNRGLLIAERQPEVGPLGNSQILYSYDASGNLLTRDIVGSSEFSLRYRYDPANRLLTVDEVVTPSPETVRPLKQFHYARTNDGPNRRAGKLVLAKRINWVDPVDPLPGAVGNLPIVLSQAFRYEGRDGRISERQTRYNLGTGHYIFETGFEWDQQGHLSRLVYPRCLHDRCVGEDPARTVDFSYQRGFLSAVPGWATRLSYQLGGMLDEVTHTNGISETIAVDPVHPRERPYQITTSLGVATQWDSGVYDYDGAGNVQSIGDQSFTYDRRSRLLEGQVDVGGSLSTQTITYDAYGNPLSLITDGGFVSTPVNAATNRLTSGTYDAGGNLTDYSLLGETFALTYDPLNTLKFLQSNNDQARVFIYDTDEERILTFDCVLADCAGQEPTVTTTLRGLDGKVLRVYTLPTEAGNWSWERDYVYRDGQLLGSAEPAGAGESRVHFHLDHLGSPRQVTSGSGAEVAFHSYYPFGGEATDPSQNELKLKFTGHERDPNGGGPGMLDYMHARYYNPRLGRFLSVDPAETREALTRPQKWNRYAYALNRPMAFVDPDGNESAGILLDLDSRALLEGELTRDEFRSRVRARGIGAGIGAIGGFGILSGTASAASSSSLTTTLTRAFQLGNFPRGRLIENALARAAGGGGLAFNFPTIDRFANGVATSVKSLDLTARSLRNLSRLQGRLEGFISKLANFRGATLGKEVVLEERILRRVLELVVKSPTPEQQRVINKAIELAEQNGVVFKLIIVP